MAYRMQPYLLQINKNATCSIWGSLIHCWAIKQEECHKYKGSLQQKFQVRCPLWFTCPYRAGFYYTLQSEGERNQGCKWGCCWASITNPEPVNATYWRHNCASLQQYLYTMEMEHDFMEGDHLCDRSPFGHQIFFFNSIYLFFYADFV